MDYDALIQLAQKKSEAARQKQRAEMLRTLQMQPSDRTFGGGSSRITVSGRSMEHVNPTYANFADPFSKLFAARGASNAEQASVQQEAEAETYRMEQIDEMTKDRPEVQRLVRLAGLGVPGADKALGNLYKQNKPQSPTGLLQYIAQGGDPELAKSLAPQYGIDPAAIDAAASAYKKRAAEEFDQKKELKVLGVPKQTKTIPVFGPDGDITTIPEDQLTSSGLVPVTAATVAERKRRDAAGAVEQSQKGLGELLDDLAAAHRSLRDKGAAVSSAQPATQNIKNYARSTAGGQIVEGALGTEEQQIRDGIEQMKPLLIQEIRKATGMSSKAMDSNRELQFYLAAATDPTRSIEANLEAVERLRKMYSKPMGSQGLGVPDISVKPDDISQEDWDLLTDDEKAQWVAGE